LAIIGYAVFQFTELGPAAAIGLILVASIWAIWSIATMTGLLGFGPVRPSSVMALFPFIMILLICGTVFWVSESSHSKLEAKEQELVTVQGQLNSTTADLNSTKSRVNDLNNQIAPLNSQIASLNKQLSDTRSQMGTAQSTITGLQNTVNQLQTELKLYHDTGITVYSGIKPPYRGAQTSITLANNSASRNVSWQELQNFVLADRTDSNYYNDFSYVCGDFALDVHNNAEAAGIKASFVVIHFKDGGDSHALDAFVTTDRGLIYIDCTGLERGEAGPTNCDKIVSVKPGTSYVETPLVPNTLWEWIPLGIISTVEIYW
jgi:uncharacterized protein YlxW (UPF0749 family)